MNKCKHKRFSILRSSGWDTGVSEGSDQSVSMLYVAKCKDCPTYGERCITEKQAIKSLKSKYERQ